MLPSARPRQSLTSLATVLKEMEEIPAYLPSGAVLRDSVQRARDWLQDVEALQVGLNVPRVSVCLWRARMENPCRALCWVSLHRLAVWVGPVTNYSTVL